MSETETPLPARRSSTNSAIGTITTFFLSDAHALILLFNFSRVSGLGTWRADSILPTEAFISGILLRRIGHLSPARY